MNKVILSGRLTKDPEVRYTGEGTAVAKYTIAVDRNRKDADGKQQADFIRCVAFGKLGEFAEKYLTKGTKIMVEGRIQTGSFEGDDGKRVYTQDVIVERHEFCESKKAGAEGSHAADETPAGFEAVDDDDMPF